MEINVIGNKERWGDRPKLMDDDHVYFHDLPDLTKNPLHLVKFFRNVKKSMVLYWLIDDDTTTKLPTLPGRLLNKVIRTIIKKPGGPAIIIERLKASPLESVADIVVASSKHHSQTIKEAYFLAECGHPSIIYKEKKQRERIDWLKDNSDGRILEIGCSTGFVLNYVGGGTGADLDPLRLEYASLKYPKNKFLQLDAAKMPFKDKEFDTVMIPDILEHVEFEHAKKIVKEAFRVGKKLIVTVPNASKPHYDKALVENPEHRWFPTEILMREMITSEAAITFSRDKDFIYVIQK
jgi:hypothetical protein